MTDAELWAMSIDISRETDRSQTFKARVTTFLENAGVTLDYDQSWLLAQYVRVNDEFETQRKAD